jgi:hypothetical protein
MSNPLLRPNDPRFQKPDVRNAAGKNQFGESQQTAVTPPGGSEVFAAAASDEARPFVPRYEAQQQPRTGLLLLLGGLAWASAAVGTLSLAGLLSLGWICPLLGSGPGAAAWFLAYEDLKALRVGAITADAQAQTRHAFWLGLTGLLACLAIVAAMIYRRMNFFPDIL